MDQNSKPQQTTKIPKTSRGETPSELTHRHLMDANHITTDEELRNVKLDLHKGEITEQPDTNAEESEPIEKEERLLNKDQVIVSPWDAVS